MNRLLGEWLNGRATVSKTVGCVFESRLPCQRRHMALLASARSARLRAFCFQACVSFSPRENATTHHAPRFQLSRVSLIFAPRNFFHARTTPPRFITPETPLREHERRFLFCRESGDNTHFRCFATNLPHQIASPLPASPHGTARKRPLRKVAGVLLSSLCLLFASRKCDHSPRSAFPTVACFVDFRSAEFFSRPNDAAPFHNARNALAGA